MNRLVDQFGRALLDLMIRSTGDENSVEVAAWVDTAFNGELVAPQAIIDSLGLVQSAGIRRIGPECAIPIPCDSNLHPSGKLVKSRELSWTQHKINSKPLQVRCFLIRLRADW